MTYSDGVSATPGNGLPPPPPSRPAAPPSIPTTPSGLSTISSIHSMSSSPYPENGTSRRFVTPSRVTSSRVPGSNASHAGPTMPRGGYDGSSSAFHSGFTSRMASPMRGEAGGGLTKNGAQVAPAVDELLTVNYGTRIVLRRPNGRALSVHMLEGQPHYRLGLQGLGLGDALEMLTLHSTVKRDDKGPVTYGAVLAVRCPWAKEKCLALQQSSKQVGFFRSLVGSFEKWTLQRPEAVHSGRTTPASVMTAGSSLAGGSSRLKGKGEVVSAGDQVVLVAHNNEVLVVRDEEGEAAELMTVPVDQALLSKATWEVCVAGIPHYPSWRLSRSYLTGDFLLKTERHAKPPPQVEELYGMLTHVALKLQPKVEPLSTFGVETQEQLLIEDLLGTISGYEGRYIKVEAAHDGPAVPRSVQELSFGLDVDSVDRSLASVAAKFFPLGARVVRIRKFIELKRRPDYGMVAQALAAGLQSVMKEYMVQVAQLEHKWRQRSLSLTKMWFLLQPSMRTLEILDKLCHTVQGSKGGALLNLIRSCESGGDDKSAKLHSFLLQRASVPYMEMLEAWVYHGRLDDPYQEFMVREEQSLQKENVEEDFNAAYWDARYTIQSQHVFSALEEYSHEILTTGKYLNVFRECGQEVPAPPEESELRYQCGGQLRAGFGEAIERAYTRSCGLLLDLLRKENNLLQCLSSIKHYFLLYKGDFFVHFMNVAETVLLQDVSEVSISRLESLLHLSIQMSAAASSDRYKDDVSCTFARHQLLRHLTAIHQSDRGMSSGSFSSSSNKPPATPAGSSSALHSEPADSDPLGLPPALMQGSDGALKAYETFMLEYHVRWPLSLVVSRRAVTKYQLLFRHLFFTKYVERRLHTTWADQQATKELDVRGAMGQAFCLRHRMQHFIENYVYYMMFEVIEPHWHSMHTNLLTNVQNIDDVIRMHQEFQDTCLKECLLTNQPLLKLLNRILYLCMRFSIHMSAVVKDQQAKDAAEERFEDRGCKVVRPSGFKPQDARRVRIQAQTESARLQASQPEFVQAIVEFQRDFDQHLGDFMKRLWDDSRAQYHSHLANLCTRLDYNGFLSSQYIAGDGHKFAL